MAIQANIDALRKTDVPAQRLLIDGTWQKGSGEALEIYSPIDGQKLTTLEQATAEDVARATKAARKVLEPELAALIRGGQRWPQHSARRSCTGLPTLSKNARSS